MLAGLSENRITFDERYRFESLIRSLRPNSANADDETMSITSEVISETEVDEQGAWEFRTAGFALINALVNSPDDVDERVLLRDELVRRGLNEVITVHCCVSSLVLLPNTAHRHFATAVLPML